MSRTYKFPHKNELEPENIDEQRWNAKSLNIPRTKRLSNFFLISKEENEELFQAEEELEEKEKESWLFAC